MRTALIIFTALFMTGYVFTIATAKQTPTIDEIDALLSKVSKNVESAGEVTKIAQKMNAEMDSLLAGQKKVAEEAAAAAEKLAAEQAAAAAAKRERLRAEKKAAAKKREEIFAVEGLLGRHRRASGGQKGGKQIDVDHGDIAAAAGRGDAGPAYEERLADAAFVVAALVAA